MKYTLPIVAAVLLMLAAQCQAGAFADGKLSECQRKRRDNLALVESQKTPGSNANRLAIVVPECNTDGSYKNLQCHHNSTFCQCWDSEGLPQTQPSTQLRHCSCSMQKAKELKALGGREAREDEVTKCSKDGHFDPLQCKRDSCHCVDKITGQQSGITGKKGAIKCQ